MSFLWECRDPFEDRNQLFKASAQEIPTSGTSPTGASPTGGSPTDASPTGTSPPWRLLLNTVCVGGQPEARPLDFAHANPGHQKFQSNQPKEDMFTLRKITRSKPQSICHERTSLNSWEEIPRNRTLSSNSNDLSRSSHHLTGGTSETYIVREPITKKIGPNYCTFCKTNGEIKSVYTSHPLKEFVNSKIKVVCPVLRKLTCKICGASGDDAHTMTHCPKGSCVVPIAKELKSTKRWK